MCESSFRFSVGKQGVCRNFRLEIPSLRGNVTGVSWTLHDNRSRCFIHGTSLKSRSTIIDFLLNYPCNSFMTRRKNFKEGSLRLGWKRTFDLNVQAFKSNACVDVVSSTTAIDALLLCCRHYHRCSRSGVISIIDHHKWS